MQYSAKKPSFNFIFLPSSIVLPLYDIPTSYIFFLSFATFIVNSISKVKEFSFNSISLSISLLNALYPVYTSVKFRLVRIFTNKVKT